MKLLEKEEQLRNKVIKLALTHEVVLYQKNIELTIRFHFLPLAFIDHK